MPTLASLTGLSFPSVIDLSSGDKQIVFSGQTQDSADGFVQSTEFAALYGANPTNVEVVNKYYENVLHRPADSAGTQFWIDVPDRKAATLADVLIGVSESTEDQAALLGTIGNGFVFTVYH